MYPMSVSTVSSKMPQTALAAISPTESRDERKLAPQDSQRSLRRTDPLLSEFRISVEVNSVFSLVIVIPIVLLRVLLPYSAFLDGRISRTFPLVAADIEKLLSDRVLRRVNVLQVRFKERLIANAALQQIRQMVLVDMCERFGSDRVGWPSSLVVDGRLKPSLFDPKKYFGLSDMQRSCEAID
jgi:hypothetical protein